VPPTRKSAARLAVTLALLAAAYTTWALHARAWDLGGRSPVLGYDSAQYALAARELAEHGRLATSFALPIELARHATPPWPLAVVQPGLVVAEAALFRLVPLRLEAGPEQAYRLALPSKREWLTLLVPLVCFLALVVVVAAFGAGVLARHAPGIGDRERRLAAVTLGLAVALDPEAQHFATGGFTELPFTLGLVTAFGLLLDERASRHPLRFGLLLGVTGTFRATMLWLAPVLAVAAALIAPGRRVRTAVSVLIGYAVVLAPWWFYKWRVFGTPGWDLSRFVLWEGVQGRSWFSLFHLPEDPAVPHGLEAARLVAAKTAQRLPALLVALATGPRALWIGALVLWAAFTRPPRTAAIVAWTLLATAALALLTAAASIPWIRFLFPARVPLEAAGVLALWGLVARAPATLLGPRAARLAALGVIVLALGWGVSQTARGLAEARAAADARGVPDAATMRSLGARVAMEVPRGEVVMSNLGPTLAWASGHPVVHLALTPADVAGCRRRVEFRHVVLAFRDPDQAWPGWREAMARPEDAPSHPEWNVVRERHWQERDGFQIVWLELGPPEPRVALVTSGAASDDQTWCATMFVAPSAREASSTSCWLTQRIAP
jgi:hypothetical protein